MNDTNLLLKRAELLALLRREIDDHSVIEAISRVPREAFVPSENLHQAYDNRPLAIGHNQTISQPSIVARMTQALEIKPGQKILEVGTGSGYQTAVMAEMAEWIITTERIPQLSERATLVLEQLGYSNIEFHITRESLGWPPQAPYDAIMVTAGAPEIPAELLEQLKINGKMVIPVGSLHEQELYRVTRRLKDYTLEKLGGCRFVPLISKTTWQNQ